DYYNEKGFSDVYKKHLSETNIKYLDKGKFFKFYSSASKYQVKGFTNNNFSDTSYISKVIKEHLEKNGNKVFVSKGGHTSLLRKILFGNNFFVSDFNLDDDEKNRNDHRHHFIDALCVSIMEPKIIQKLHFIRNHDYKNSVESGKAAGFRKSFRSLINDDFKNSALNKFKNMNISIEEKLNPNGALNLETAYGLYRSEEHTS